MRIGARLIVAPIWPTKVVSACGPPVDEPISSARGGDIANGRSVKAKPSACGTVVRRGGAAQFGARARPDSTGEREAAAAAEIADFIDQLAMKRHRHRGIGGGL